MSTRLRFVHTIFSMTVLAASVAPSFAISETADVNNSANVDATRIGALEWRMFSHPYERDSVGKRLARLERLAFGAERADLDDASRLAKLSAAVKIRSNRNIASVNLPSRSVVGRGTSSLPPASPSVSQRNSGNQSSYPSVSELESKVFSTTYVSMPVASRLQNLEIRVFGKVSQSDDMCARTEALSNYVNATFSTPKKIPFQWLCNFVDPTMLPQKVHATTVVDRIETMETKFFGKTFANKSLEKRVCVLEQSIIGVVDENGSQDLSVRVAQLWTRVQNPQLSKA